MPATPFPALPARAVRGRGVGIIVGSLFAAAWANWARILTQPSPADWRWLAVAAGMATTVALVAAGIALVRRARSLAAGTGGADRTRMRRRFGLILAGEIIAFNLVAFTLFALGQPQYLAPAIAIIVGLHFFPLAPTFDAPHFRVTGTVMTLAGVIAVLSIAGGSPAGATAGTACVACALTLWATAFVSWQRTRRALAAAVVQTA